MKKDITVIVPIHEFNDEIKMYLEKAFDSCNNLKADEFELMVVGPSTVIQEVENMGGIDARIKKTFIENKGETDFCSQINLAAKECKTQYFSVLEFDDVYRPKWFENFYKYSENKPDVSLFLPLGEMFDTDGQFYSFLNEVVLATSFSTELGYIDLECLKVYYDFNVTGGIFKTEDFLSVGGLKSSIKIAFWYEFLMRMCHNGMKIFVVPKLSYRHTIGRNGSLMVYNKENIDQKEAEFFYRLASQEYTFKKDRKKEYKPEK